MPELDKPPPFTAEAKLAAIRRELAYRERVYPQRVAAEKMSQTLANYQLRIMRAIEADYVELAKGERLI